MPNQRAKDKKSLTFWVNEDIKSRLEAFCASEGLTRTAAIQKILEIQLDELESPDRQKLEGEKSKKRARKQQ